MAQPIDYTQGFINPTQSIMQTLQMGQALGQIGQMRDQRIIAQQAAQASLAEQEARAKKQKEMEEAFKAAHDNPTYENYRRLADMSPPEQAESFRKSWDRLDEMQQKQALNDSVSIYAGFLSGAPEVSMSMIQDRMNAAKNAGDENSAKRYQTMIDLYNTGPEGVKAVRDMFGMSISGMPGGKDAMEALSKFGEEQRAAAAEPDAIKKRLADIGFTEAQTNKVLAETRKLDAELKNLAVEAAIQDKSGGLTAKNKADMEIQLNNTVNSRTAATRESTTSYENIRAGASASDGVGDLAVINTFMRMLSPGIVTEQDYTSATKSGGLLDELKTLGAKVEKGELLSQGQRDRFVNLAKTFMENAKKQNEEQLTGVRAMVKNYDLTEENIFGSMSQGGTATAQSVTTAAQSPSTDVDAVRAFLKQKWPAEAAKIDSFPLEKLQLAYKNTLEGSGLIKTAQPVVTGDF